MLVGLNFNSMIISNVENKNRLLLSCFLKAPSLDRGGEEEENSLDCRDCSKYLTSEILVAQLSLLSQVDKGDKPN